MAAGGSGTSSITGRGARRRANAHHGGSAGRDRCTSPGVGSTTRRQRRAAPAAPLRRRRQKARNRPTRPGSGGSGQPLGHPSRHLLMEPKGSTAGVPCGPAGAPPPRGSISGGRAGKQGHPEGGILADAAHLRAGARHGRHGWRPHRPDPAGRIWRWRSIARHGLSWLPRQCEGVRRLGAGRPCARNAWIDSPSPDAGARAVPCLCRPGPRRTGLWRLPASPHAFDRAVAVVDYVFPWDRLITRMKFHQRPDLARALAPALAETVLRAAVPRPDVLVPDACKPLAADRAARLQPGLGLCRSLARQLHPRVTACSFEVTACNIRWA